MDNSLKFVKQIINKLQKTKSFELTEERRQCLQVLQDTNQNLFITGKAGTGKSLLIQYFREHTKKKVIVLAPTGLAAMNAHGQTIHSFFNFPPCLIEVRAMKKNPERIFANIDCIIIDEISMVRADLLDGIDRLLRLNGKDEKLPFGGIQMVFIGDLFQLPPVIGIEEQEAYYDKYDSPYFFASQSFRLEDFTIIEFTTIFRQRETEFVNFLNKVRIGEATIEDFNLINSRLVEKPPDTYTILCTINKTADSINQEKLSKIRQPLFTFMATVEDDFPTENRNLPVDLELNLKKGARVLFVKNDMGRRWVNGSLGTVHKVNQNIIQVQVEESKEIVDVKIEEWNNIKYAYNQNTGEWNENLIGKLKQYPLRLAWAITVHKSQGMTLDKVCLDFRRSPFTHGQTYVALSRCRSLAGLILTRKLWPNDVLIDERIVEFNNRLLRT